VIEIDGVVTGVGFVNPHSYVYFDITGKNGGIVAWHCEMRGAAVFLSVIPYQSLIAMIVRLSRNRKILFGENVYV
jgi:hypothetical protein